MGKIAGRFRTEARMRVNSALVTGFGATVLTGPESDSWFNTC